MSYRNPVRSVGVSGEVAVVGTVATSGGGSSGGDGTTPPPAAPAFQGATATTGSGQVTAATPAETTSASMLVAWVQGQAGTTITAPQGWAQIYYQNTSLTVFYKMASSADAAGAGRHLFTTSNGVIAVTMMALAGVSAVAQDSMVIKSFTTSTSTTIASPSCTSNQILVGCQISGTSNEPGAMSWAASGSGGPAAPQPTWTDVRSVAAINQWRFGVVVPSWSTAASYTIVAPTNPSGSSTTNRVYVLRVGA